ncbi:MAG: 7-cyano-7-deazaguanine synthase [Solirubrobacteraceae bacterium]
MADVHVVIDDCTTPEGGDVRAVRTRNTTAGTRNWRFNPERIANGLPGTLNDRQMDWLEINSAIHAADRVVGRDPGLDWNRSIELHVPVRDPGFWNGHTATFEDIFSSLTFDRLALTVHAGEQFSRPPRTRSKPFADADCIALLSGGLDSFVGALELVKQGAKPLFLAASGSGATGHAQAEVAEVVKGQDASLEVLKLVCQRMQGFPGKEDSQRGRSLLYLSCAALVATALGIEDVYLNENGIMAIHLPLTAARHGSFSTRTASPRVLTQIAALASTTLGANVAVHNLLVGLTKPEVTARAKALGHADDVKSTVSCWSISHRSTHCGYCSPCLMRRISCLVHNVEDVTYELDVLNDAPTMDKADAKDTLTHFIEVAQDFRELDDFDLELTYPDLINGASAMSIAETIAMYRRWADQVLDTLVGYPVPRSLMT